MRPMISMLMAVLLIAGTATAFAGGGENKGKAGKTHFLVELKHTPEECLAALDRVSAEDAKLLDDIQWGCMAGDHTGYLIISAENETAARNLLPSEDRDKATVVALNKFTVAQIKSFHEKK